MHLAPACSYEPNDIIMNAKTLFKLLFLALTLSLFLMGSVDADAARKKRGADAEQKKEVIYPDATRAEPKVKPSPRLERDLNKLITAHNDDKYEDVIKQGEQIAGNKSAGSYERSVAYQLIGIAKQQLDDYPGAIAALQKAVDANGLDNNAHYGSMLQIANLQYQEDQFEQANATLDHLLAETRKEDPQTLALKGGTLYQMERYGEAAEAMKRAIAASDKPSENWYQLLMGSYMNQENYAEATALGERMLAEKPDDARLIFNLATMYAQNEQDDKATAVLEAARQRGNLDERGYRQLYALYMNMEGKEAQVIAVVNEGLDKKILEPSTEVYTVLGQAYYFSDRSNEAIEAYKKALPLAKDGENALNLARILSTEERHAESKKYAQEALAKGLRQPGAAWIVIGRAEFGLGNRAGLVAAYREAAKYPETKQTAEEWLRKNASR